MDEVEEVLADAMDIIKDRMPDLYHETIHQLEAIAYAITPEEARDKVRSMRALTAKSGIMIPSKHSLPRRASTTTYANTTSA